MIKWLLTPDSFPGDRIGYALNQIGHVALGATLAWAAGLPAALALCLGWEAVHLSRGGTLADSAEDYGFVAAGVLSMSVVPFAWLVVLPFLSAGILSRGRA